MSTPYSKHFDKDAILVVTESGAWFQKGELIKLARDDRSEVPYFESLLTGKVHCIHLYRVRAATETEIATLNQSAKASEEENEMTPFQKAGYTQDTVFVRRDGAYLQLNEDDGSECPYFNYAGTTTYAGVEYLNDLEVVEVKEKQGVEESNELTQTLEGIVISLQGAREEVARLEALLKEKSAELGITIVVGARPSAEGLAQEQAVQLIETAQQAWTLKEGDKVQVSAKPDQVRDVLSDSDLMPNETYVVDRIDLYDERRPVLLGDEDGDAIAWIDIGKLNLHKLS